jgi:hypothetical protein
LVLTPINFLIIAGGRDFNNYTWLEESVSGFIADRQLTDIEVVCGGARGADALGKQYAENNGIAVKMFLANWKTYGRRAGPIRNRHMAEYATHCIVFWDELSRVPNQ